MPEPESPQIRWDRVSALIVATLVCLAVPSIVVLVYDVPGSDAVRREPLYWLLIWAAAGAAIPFVYWSPYRALGFIGYSAIAWVIVAGFGVVTGRWAGWAIGAADRPWLCVSSMSFKAQDPSS